MKVVCPYTKLHPVTKGVLDSYGLQVRYVPLKGDYAYGELLRDIWIKRDPVVIVEHDIVPWPGCVEELYGCPGEWCTCSYSYNGGLGISHMLGCAKLSTALMDALPNLWDDPCHWADCDRRLFFSARDIRKEPHQHRPAVIHLKGIAA